jgi:NitT/TauT family transport system substrate-binding protein
MTFLKKKPAWRSLLASMAAWSCVAFALLATGTLHAAETIKIGVGTGIGYLPLQVMVKKHLLETAARNAGAGDVTAELIEFPTASAMTDALVSGAIQYASGGVSTFAVLWAKAEGSNEIRGIGALVSMPMYLNTRNPRVKTIKDFGEGDRIGVAGIKSSYQAMLIQMAAADAFGFENYTKLDPLTVAISNPNGVIVMANQKSEINSHFSPPPFAKWELRQPDTHTVLTSYDILGGPATLNMVWGATRFATDKPKLHAAFWAALQEATRELNADKAAAAQIYLDASGDKKSTVAETLELLNDPQVIYDVTPHRVMRVMDFLAKAGAIKRRAASWQDLYFPEVRALPGS